MGQKQKAELMIDFQAESQYTWVITNDKEKVI